MAAVHAVGDTELKASDGSQIGQYRIGGNPYWVAFDGVHVWVSQANGASVAKL